MGLIQKIRFPMSTIMMLVIMSAAGMALFVKIQQVTERVIAPVGLAGGWNFDVPSLFLLAIVLTAVALSAWKEHSAVQTMIQVTLACFGCLTLIWVSEAQYDRTIRYWCQATFAMTVTLPMLARRYVKASMVRGPRRDWWKKTCEAVFFSFLTLMLVAAGGLLQVAVYTAGSSIPIVGTPPTTLVPPPPTPVTPPTGPSTATRPSPAGPQSPPPAKTSAGSKPNN